MRKYRVLFLILLLSLCFSATALAQDKGGPPPPDTKRHGKPPCSDRVNPGQGNGPSVPPGLCLPIDDYVYLLMAVGVMYGCYKMRKFETD